jgi:hypothetical protein
MAIKTVFNPAWGSGITVSPTSSSASAEIGGGNKTVVFTNTGTNVCYVRCGDSSVTATTADYPVVVGQQVAIGKFQDYTHVAYISAGGTDLHIIAGEGL